MRELKQNKFLQSFVNFVVHHFSITTFEVFHLFKEHERVFKIHTFQHRYVSFVLEI